MEDLDGGGQGVAGALLCAAPQDLEGLGEDGQGLTGTLLCAAPRELEGIDMGGQGVCGALLCPAPRDVKNLAEDGQGVAGAFLALPPGIWRVLDMSIRPRLMVEGMVVRSGRPALGRSIAKVTPDRNQGSERRPTKPIRSAEANNEPR